MKKYPIGFYVGRKEVEVKPTTVPHSETKEPKKSLVQIYFPSRGLHLSYFNDKFDLKVGDMVYVEGKLEGHKGQVTDISYSFKIKLSDYKKVIAVIDTTVRGDFYFADAHLVTFDKNALPYEKALTWFNAPENEDEYVSGDDGENRFPLDDLSKMKITHEIAERGKEYYLHNRVKYISIDGIQGRAIVEGSDCYEVELEYYEGEIRNLKCSCFCGYNCKHEFAVMLQLKETLDIISKNYEDKHNDYFAVICKDVFVNTVMSQKENGKISLGV